MFNCFIEDDLVKIVSADGFTDYNLIAEDLIDKLKNTLPNSPKKEIVFTFQGEPFNPHFYNKIFYVLPKLINANLCVKIKIYTGVDPLDENVEFYKKMCEANHWAPIEISFFNTWEAGEGKNLRLLDQSEEYFPKIRKKMFICLNNGFRPNRLQLLSEIINNDLLNFGFVSFLCGLGNSKEIILNFIRNDNYIKKYMPKGYMLVKDTIEKNIDLFPLTLDFDPAFGDREDWFMKYQHSSNLLLDCYKESYFSIVNETIFYHHSFIPGEMYDGYFFSEKIWKSISLKQPFILCSSQNSLAILRKKGYKTFHPYINESYDLEYGENRILAVIKEIKRLSKFNDSEWLTWQQNVKSIVDHNHFVLKNASLIEKNYNTI